MCRGTLRRNIRRRRRLWDSMAQLNLNGLVRLSVGVPPRWLLGLSCLRCCLLLLLLLLVAVNLGRIPVLQLLLLLLRVLLMQKGVVSPFSSRSRSRKGL